MVGPPCSGKTWLVHRFCSGSVPTKLDHPPILGCDMRAAFVRLAAPDRGCSVGRLRIWEPSGLSRQPQSVGYLTSSAAVMVVVCASDADAPKAAREYLDRVAAIVRPGTVLLLCCAQADQVPCRGASVLTDLAEVAAAFRAELVCCSASTGQGVEDVFCIALAACQEAGLLKERTIPVLSRDAGTLTNSELLRALLHRR